MVCIRPKKQYSKVRIYWITLTLSVILLLGFFSSTNQRDNCILSNIRDNVRGELQSNLFSLQLTLENITQTPLIVEYFQTANITAEIVNNSIATVILTFRANGGFWNHVTMTNLTAVTYIGHIPPQPWDAFIEYFVNATDTLGFSTIGDNDGGYYNYRVVDTILPIIQITSPSPGYHFTSPPPEVNAAWEDAGSGINYVEVYIDDILDVTFASSMSDGGIMVPEGHHRITFIAYDKAGNSARAYGHYSYDPPTEPPEWIPGFPLSAIILGLVIALILSVRLRRLKIRNT